MTNERTNRGTRDRDEDEDTRGRRDSGRVRGGRERDDDLGARRSSSARSSFSYRERDRGEVTRRAEAKGANEYDKLLKDGIKTYKPADGDNRIRILPPTWDNAKHFGLDIYVHYGVGPDKATYLCLQKMKGSADPIEEEWQEARRGTDEEYTKQLDAKKRVLVYVIDRNNEKEGVQAWSMPWTVDRDIVKVSVDRSNGEVLPIDHPDEGYDVEFSKSGKAARTEYTGIAISRRSTPLGKDEWLDYAVENPLPEQLVYFDYDYIARVFRGQGTKKSAVHADDGSDARTSQRRDATPEKDASSEQLTWDDVHSMSGAELDDLVEQEGLDIDVDKAKNDEDLADWVCEEMGIKEKRREVPTSRRSAAKADDDDVPTDTASRLRDMRNRSRG